jgi:glycosyltransferase involved in cell wall biosynthesis
MLYVDTRWVGKSGIARFASEVTTRLSTSYRPLASTGHPASPRDLLKLGRLRLTSSDVLYSPGFNCGPSRAQQYITIHDLIHLDDAEETSHFKRYYYDHVVRPVVRKTGRVMTVSEVSRRRISDWIDDDSVDIVNVGNGCSAIFRPSVTSKDRGAHFLYVGTSKPHKNLRVVLEALKLNKLLKLTIVCSDPERVKQAVQSHGVSSSVSILSGLTDFELSEEYRSCAFVVLPSEIEGFGLPALEALSCGKRVLYFTGCASVAEIVGNSGIGVSSSSSGRDWAESMTQALLAFHQDLDSAAVEALTAPYQWDQVAARVSIVLKSASYEESIN